jgi:hypothetical protein
MDADAIAIKSLAVQNTIMLVALGTVVGFLLWAIVKRRFRHAAVFIMWVLVVVWFFNSPFFGFSAVTVSRRGIEIAYGALSLRDALLPLDTPWKIERTFGGIKKNRVLHYLAIGGHQSMKVAGKEGLETLQRIGEAIERTKSRSNAGNSSNEKRH